MTTSWRSRAKPSGDDGLGVITVVLMGAVITALIATATIVTVNNLGNTSRDRQSLGALATSEAGVAQAVQFLRGGNLASLSCDEPAPGDPPGASCTGPGPSWTSATDPMPVRLDGTTGACTGGEDCFEVWIGTVKEYQANCAERRDPAIGTCYGEYRIHSTGISGHGPSAREVAVDVKVSPYPFPIGVFADSFSGNGNVGIHQQSLFTNGCVFNRQRDDQNGSGLQFAWDDANNRPVLDLIYDQPSAAHAVGSISTSNGGCGFESGGGPIHLELQSQGQGKDKTTVEVQKVCNSDFIWDQSGDGGPLSPGDGCYGKYVRGDGTVYPTTSKFDESELRQYGYRPRGLTDAQYDALKAQAQAQGTYNLPSGNVESVLTGLVAAGISSPVLFWDNGDVTLQQNDFPTSFQRDLSDAEACASNSVTIVVEGHDLDYSGGNNSPWLVASIFVPDGELTGQGGRNTIGTAFAKEIDLGGNVDFHMDQCFASNPPGGTLDIQVTNWREDDSKDVN